jgi:hypothetical protein
MAMHMAKKKDRRYVYVHYYVTTTRFDKIYTSSTNPHNREKHCNNRAVSPDGFLFIFSCLARLAISASLEQGQPLDFCDFLTLS